MKIEILVSDDKKSFSISVNGSPPVPMDNFLLLTKEGEKTRNLVFGSTEDMGRVLYGLYVNCWRMEETEMRDVLELVATDILDIRESRIQAGRETLRRVI